MESSQKTYLQSSHCLWRDIMDYVQPQIAEGEEKLPKRFKKEVKKPSAGKSDVFAFIQPAGAAETQKMDGNSTMDIQSVPYRGRKRKHQASKEGSTRTATNFKDTELQWVLETPYDIRDEAMNDLLKGYSSNFAANRKKFKMKLRSKKDPQQSITILSKHWGKSRGEYAFLSKIESVEPLPYNCISLNMIAALL